MTIYVPVEALPIFNLSQIHNQTIEHEINVFNCLTFLLNASPQNRENYVSNFKVWGTSHYLYASSVSTYIRILDTCSQNHKNFCRDLKEQGCVFVCVAIAHVGITLLLHT